MWDSSSLLAGQYNDLDGCLGQVVRRALISRALELHLPSPPARILDIGGGAGQQSIPLARAGYEITILDSSSEMLAEAERRLSLEDTETRRGMRLVEGLGEQALEALGASVFDAALCHGVLMYLDSPDEMARALAAVVRPGGIVSALAKNAEALAMRPGLRGEHREALTALDTNRSAGGLGVVTRGDTVAGLSRTFEEAGLALEEWYGVRVFTDHIGDSAPGEGLQEILELEREVGRRDPYRSVARLIHVLGKRQAG